MIRSKLVLAGLVAAALATATAVAPATGIAGHPSAPGVVTVEGGLGDKQSRPDSGDPDDLDGGRKGGMTCCFF